MEPEDTTLSSLQNATLGLVNTGKPRMHLSKQSWRTTHRIIQRTAGIDVLRKCQKSNYLAATHLVRLFGLASARGIPSLRMLRKIGRNRNHLQRQGNEQHETSYGHITYLSAICYAGLRFE